MRSTASCSDRSARNHQRLVDHLARDGCEPIGAASHQRDPGTGRVELAGDRLADAPARAGDDGGPAGEVERHDDDQVPASAATTGANAS